MSNKKLIALLVLGSSAVFAEASIEGTYKCNGIDPYLNNKAYTGKLVVKAQGNNVYHTIMDYDEGDKKSHDSFIYIGVGLFNNNVLSIGFQNKLDMSSVGMQNYTYTATKNQLQGNWVYLEKNKVGHETCVKQ